MEKPPKNKIENPRSPESEDDERLKAFMEMHPENFPNPDSSKELNECGPLITELENLFTEFKENHSLEELNAITHLKFEDAKDHSVREPARLALAPIFKKFKEIKNETNISLQKLTELELQREELSRAVGIINDKGEVDHTRGL